MYTANELFFPSHVIPSLRNLRGEKWRSLVCHVSTLPACHEEKLAFMLMMAQLNGCGTCETDSFRAMRGCGACAAQSLRRYKGTDDELIESYQAALKEVRSFLEADTRLNRFVQRSADVELRHKAAS